MKQGPDLDWLAVQPVQIIWTKCKEKGFVEIWKFGLGNSGIWNYLPLPKKGKKSEKNELRQATTVTKSWCFRLTENTIKNPIPNQK